MLSVRRCTPSLLIERLFVSNLSPAPPPVAKDELLTPENDTIGVLVSTALEMTIGGKTIKPAGGCSSERGNCCAIMTDVSERDNYTSAFVILSFSVGTSRPRIYL